MSLLTTVNATTVRHVYILAVRGLRYIVMVYICIKIKEDIKAYERKEKEGKEISFLNTFGIV